MKARSFKEFRDEQLHDPEVRREYEAAAQQFSLAAQVLQLRKELDLTQRQLADALDAEPEIHLRKRGA
jgi:hypothetical protein